MTFRQDHRFGSARWADEADIARAGLFHPKGLRIGYFGQKPLHYASDGSVLLVGGAGSGKGRDLLIELIIRAVRSNLWMFDPKGELTSVALPAFVHAGVKLYTWNPYMLHGLAHHRINPLGFLRADDIRFAANTRLIAESLIALSGSASGQYFEQSARQWLDAFLQTIVLSFGKADFKRLYWLVSAILSDPEGWDQILSFMEQSGNDFLRRIAGEIWQKQKNAEREFAGVYSTLTQNLSFLNSPQIMDALSGEDFDLEEQARTPGVSVAFVAPIEYTQQLAGLIRCFFTVSQINKAANPQGPRLYMIVDEAGNMGRFNSLLKAVTYGRGIGITALPVFQDIGQIERAYDRSTVMSFIGSCPCRIFMGTRDIETARIVSGMIGQETLAYNNVREQQDARRHSVDAVSKFLSGEGDLHTAMDILHQSHLSTLPTKMQRSLLTPDEALSLPQDHMVIFLDKDDLPPILVRKYPYYTTPSLNGLWLPNPYHPPYDRVRLPGTFGTKEVPVITEAVPPSLTHLPQYNDQPIRYIQGYRPW